VEIGGVEIEDTFAEAFDMWGARLIVTAVDQAWARTAAEAATGLATSIIGCGCEAGTNELDEREETPDGRPGVAALFFTMSRSDMEKQLLKRVGQAVMTSATSACYDGLGGDERVKIGSKLRFFGDGHQGSKLLAGRRLWRVPVMDGEFVVEESFGMAKGIGGGNFFILARDQATALRAAGAAVDAIRAVPGVVLPFPGGVVRSGSKTTSRYKGQHASTNTPFCPTVRGLIEDSALREGENAVLEIVLDALREDAMREAMRVGVTAACLPGVTRITAGNYGGALGQFQFHLHELLTASA
jgi:formylmethanofuran--tetrahydromethanopterin N-formyltransferase